MNHRRTYVIKRQLWLNVGEVIKDRDRIRDKIRDRNKERERIRISKREIHMS